ncbi:hypothetical protein MYX65_11405 [Acidobacteria bacterium AH-259-L09]|nr:hypothetical protein [Acidobacteria bacterium AH-259-L09]
MAALYQQKNPEFSRLELARRLHRRLAACGIKYHLRTVRRQLTGAVFTVRPEVETAMRELLLESDGFQKTGDIKQALADAGLQIPQSKRVSPYVAIESIVPLAQLWLHLNPGKSKRFLALHLQQELACQDIHRSINHLEKVLAGKHYRLVRREVREELMTLFRGHGLYSEASVREHCQSLARDIRQSLESRSLESSHRLTQLAWVWKGLHREASSRRLAFLLQRKMSEEGVSIGLAHLQRLVDGKVRRVRRRVVTAMEIVLPEKFPQLRNLEEEIAKLTPTRIADLSWVKAKPIASLARAWIAEHPGYTMRQLAIRVSKTVRRMGYASTHNTIQPILGGHREKTRGFIYRAMLNQFKGRVRCKIPDKHLIKVGRNLQTNQSGEKPEEARTNRPLLLKGSRAPRSRRKATLEQYLSEARSYLPVARSPHFLSFVTFRAERLYAIPRKEAEARILGLRASSDFLEPFEESEHVPEELTEPDVQ